MGVSLNGGTPKSPPQYDHFWEGKPMVVGETQHFRKPPHRFSNAWPFKAKVVFTTNGGRLIVDGDDWPYCTTDHCNLRPGTCINLQLHWHWSGTGTEKWMKSPKESQDKAWKVWKKMRIRRCTCFSPFPQFSLSHLTLAWDKTYERVLWLI